MEPRGFLSMMLESAYVMGPMSILCFLFAIGGAPQGSPWWHGLFSVMGITFIGTFVYTLAILMQMSSSNVWVKGQVTSVDTAEFVKVKRGAERRGETVPYVVIQPLLEKTAKKAKAEKPAKKSKPDESRQKDKKYVVSFLDSSGRPKLKKGDKVEISVEEGFLGTKVLKLKHEGQSYRTAARL